MDNRIKYYKNKYFICFYGKDDETYINSFNNIKEICAYRKLALNDTNLNMIQGELYRALKRPDHYTEMLTGKGMHVYLIEYRDDEDEY